MRGQSRHSIGGGLVRGLRRTWEEYRALGYADVPNRAWLRAHCRQEGETHAVADVEVCHFVDCEVKP